MRFSVRAWVLVAALAVPIALAAVGTAASGDTLPSEPSSLQIHTGFMPGTVNVHWSDARDPGSSPVEAYRVYSVDEDGARTLLHEERDVSGPNTLQLYLHVIEGLEAGERVTLHVTALNSAGEGPAAIGEGRALDLPGSPAWVTVDSVRHPHRSYTAVIWMPPVDTRDMVRGYRVYRGEDPHNVTLVGETRGYASNRFDDVEVPAPGETFHYRVSALNPAGESELSAPATLRGSITDVGRGGGSSIPWILGIGASVLAGAWKWLHRK